MNTFRNLAALALLAFAAVSPASAQDKVEHAKSANLSHNETRVIEVLKQRPEIAALIENASNDDIASALKTQLRERLTDEQASALGQSDEAAAAVLDEYLKDHPAKDGKDAAALLRDGKALADALKARFK